MRRCFLLALCVCLTLCACGRSTPTRYYVLESAAPEVASGDMPATSLRVAAVSVPQYLDRTSLVQRGAQAGSLNVDDTQQWAEPLAEGVRRVVQEALAAPLRQKGVHVLANADDSDSDYVLFIHVERLEAFSADTARLAAQWRCEKNRRIVGQGVFSASEKMAGEGTSALVQAHSALVRQMAAWILERLPVSGAAKR